MQNYYYVIYTDSLRDRVKRVMIDDSEAYYIYYKIEKFKEYVKEEYGGLSFPKSYPEHCVREAYKEFIQDNYFSLAIGSGCHLRKASAPCPFEEKFEFDLAVQAFYESF